DLPRLKLPLTPAAARALKLGDLFLLDGDAVATVGMPTQKRMVSEVAAGREMPTPMRGSAFFHMGVSYDEVDGRPGRLHYVNPTTSSRFNGLMPAMGVSYDEVDGRPGRLHYVNPTTSSRFNGLMPA
ncbi:hypothetical protein AB4156_44750, partial [Cupriavidus sp. 2MCAB6]